MVQLLELLNCEYDPFSVDPIEKTKGKLYAFYDGEIIKTTGGVPAEFNLAKLIKENKIAFCEQERLVAINVGTEKDILKGVKKSALNIAETRGYDFVQVKSDPYLGSVDEFIFFNAFFYVTKINC